MWTAVNNVKLYTENLLEEYSLYAMNTHIHTDNYGRQ